MREAISSQWAQHLAEQARVTRCGEQSTGVGPKRRNHMTRYVIKLPVLSACQSSSCSSVLHFLNCLRTLPTSKASSFLIGPSVESKECPDVLWTDVEGFGCVTLSLRPPERNNSLESKTPILCSFEYDTVLVVRVDYGGRWYSGTVPV